MVIGEDGGRLAVRALGRVGPIPRWWQPKNRQRWNWRSPATSGRTRRRENGQEVPIKADDHAVDALRYGCNYLANLGAVTLPKAAAGGKLRRDMDGCTKMR